jgi:hypothetical protein
MSTKAIYEAAGKQILNKYLGSTAAECRCISVDIDSKWDELVASNRWLEKEVRFQLFTQIMCDQCGNIISSVWLSSLIN